MKASIFFLLALAPLFAAQQPPTSPYATPAEQFTAQEYFGRLASFLNEGKVELFKESFSNYSFDTNSMSDEERKGLLLAAAKFGDKDCAEMVKSSLAPLSYHEQDDCIYYAASAGNAQALAGFSEFFEADFYNLICQPIKNIPLIVKLLESHPELTDLGTEYGRYNLEWSHELIKYVINHGTTEQLKSLLSFYQPQYIDYGMYVSILHAFNFETAKYAFQHIYCGPYLKMNSTPCPVPLNEKLFKDLLEKNFGYVTMDGCVELIKLGQETGLINAFSAEQINIWAGAILEHTLRHGDLKKKKMAISLLMDPSMSLNERITVLAREGYTAAATFLTLQLVAAKNGDFNLPGEILGTIMAYNTLE